MVKLSVITTDALVQPLEDAFCELTRSNWGIEKINDRLPPELFGYFDTEGEAKQAYEELRERFSTLPAEFSIEQINDCDWQNEYKKFLKPWNYQDLHWVPVWMRDEYNVPEGDKAQCKS